MSNKPLLNRPYLAFSLDTPEEAARRRFREKYGFEPPEVHRHKGLLWLGPIDSNDGNGRGPQAQEQPGRPAGLLRRVQAAARPLTPEQARQLTMAFLEEQS